MSEEQEMPKARRPIPESFSIQDVLKLLAERDEQHMKQMMEFAKELRKPTEREQKELDEKEKRVAELQRRRLDMAKREEDSKETKKRGCAHSTTHGGTGVTSHQWRGQVHTPAHCDPFFTPTCTQCLTQLPKIRATTEMLTQGVNLDAYKGINMDVLLKWGEQSWVGHEERHPDLQVA